MGFRRVVVPAAALALLTIALWMGAASAQAATSAQPHEAGRLRLDNPSAGVYLATFSSNSSLYRLDPQTHSVDSLGQAGTKLTDIALRGSTMYAVGFGAFYRISLATGAAQLVSSLGVGGANALVADPGTNALYGATEGGKLFKIDPDSGGTSVVGDFGSGLGSSGDLAFLNDQLFATVKRSGYSNAYLAIISSSTGRATVIGDTGFRDVYGLAAGSGYLYGATYAGDFIGISPITGQGQLFWREGMPAGGLASLPPEPDTTAPTVVASGAAAGAWLAHAVTITLTATDNTGGSGVASITYTLNGVPRTVSASSTRVLLPASPNGTRVLTYQATDAAGNVSADQSLTVQIDTTGPTTSGRAATGLSGEAITLECMVCDNLSPQAKSVTLTVKNTKHKVVKSFSLGLKTTSTWHAVKWTPNAKGAYTYHVYAKDLAGNAQVKVGSAKVVVKAAQDSPIFPMNQKAGQWYGLTYPGHDAFGAYQYSAVDFNLPRDADRGQSIYAIQDGVLQVGSDYVVVEHTKPLYLKNGTKIATWYSMYGHLARNTKLANGATVKKGAILGTISSVGADNNHLHFVIFRNWNNSRASAISPYWLPGFFSADTALYADNEDGKRDDGGEPGLYDNRIFSAPPTK